jgi:hypothetical protein
VVIAINVNVEVPSTWISIVVVIVQIALQFSYVV